MSRFCIVILLLIFDVFAIDFSIINTGTVKNPVWVLTSNNTIHVIESDDKTVLATRFRGTKVLEKNLAVKLSSGDDFVFNPIGRDPVCADTYGGFFCYILDYFDVHLSVKGFLIILVSIYFAYKFFPAIIRGCYAIYCYYTIGRYQGVFYKLLVLNLRKIVSFAHLKPHLFTAALVNLSKRQKYEDVDTKSIGISGIDASDSAV